MNPTAYIETSVVSYLTARPSREVVVAAYQEVTREWWRDAAERFDLVASELVLAEAGAGDPVAARDRLKVLQGVALLNASPDAEELARQLVEFGAVPREAAADAAHIAIAVTNGVEYLVTWNFRHIANAGADREGVQAGGLPAAGHPHAERTDGDWTWRRHRLTRSSPKSGRFATESPRGPTTTWPLFSGGFARCRTLPGASTSRIPRAGSSRAPMNRWPSEQGRPAELKVTR